MPEINGGGPSRVQLTKARKLKAFENIKGYFGNIYEAVTTIAAGMWITFKTAFFERRRKKIKSRPPAALVGLKITLCSCQFLLSGGSYGEGIPEGADIGPQGCTDKISFQ